LQPTVNLARFEQFVVRPGRDQLLDAVYGADQDEIMDRTIDVHIRRLRDKLDDDPDAPRYIATVRGSGYRAARLDPVPPVPGNGSD
jgi:DNA-binding response OmpR family regulator